MVSYFYFLSITLIPSSFLSYLIISYHIISYLLLSSPSFHMATTSRSAHETQPRPDSGAESNDDNDSIDFSHGAESLAMHIASPCCCPFKTECTSSMPFFLHAYDMMAHLKSEHRLHIYKEEEVALFATEYLATVISAPTYPQHSAASPPSPTITLGGPDNPKDMDLRQRLRMEKMASVTYRNTCAHTRARARARDRLIPSLQL